MRTEGKVRNDLSAVKHDSISYGHIEKRLTYTAAASLFDTCASGTETK